MTPRQARFALLSFAAVAAGIAFNVLVLQRRPASMNEAAADKAAAAPIDRRKSRLAPAVTGSRRTSEATSKEPSLRIARFAPDSVILGAMPEPAEDEADSTTISAIQRELKQRSYGPLPVDGFLRPATRAAIMAFEFDRGLPLTGEASPQTLKLILLGTPARDTVAGSGKVGSIHAEGIVRSVQKSLSALGYRPGAADGRLGEDTTKAIRDFEMDRGLVPKGRVSAELLARLSEAQSAARH
jgi:peptidoglycan hydrolase-like protein with peptidoglycan-binding domain